MKGPTEYEAAVFRTRGALKKFKVEFSSNFHLNRADRRPFPLSWSDCALKSSNGNTRFSRASLVTESGFLSLRVFEAETVTIGVPDLNLFPALSVVRAYIRLPKDAAALECMLASGRIATIGETIEAAILGAVSEVIRGRTAADVHKEFEKTTKSLREIIVRKLSSSYLHLKVEEIHCHSCLAIPLSADVVHARRFLGAIGQDITRFSGGSLLELLMLQNAMGRRPDGGCAACEGGGPIRRGPASGHHLAKFGDEQSLVVDGRFPPRLRRYDW